MSSWRRRRRTAAPPRHISRREEPRRDRVRLIATASHSEFRKSACPDAFHSRQSLGERLSDASKSCGDAWRCRQTQIAPALGRLALPSLAGRSPRPPPRLTEPVNDFCARNKNTASARELDRRLIRALAGTRWSWRRSISPRRRGRARRRERPAGHRNRAARKTAFWLVSVSSTSIRIELRHWGRRRRRHRRADRPRVDDAATRLVAGVAHVVNRVAERAGRAPPAGARRRHHRPKKSFQNSPRTFHRHRHADEPLEPPARAPSSGPWSGWRPASVVVPAAGSVASAAGPRRGRAAEVGAVIRRIRRSFESGGGAVVVGRGPIAEARR